MKYYRRIVAGLLIAAGCGIWSQLPLSALPPWIPLETRVREADVVLIGRVLRASSGNLSGSTRTGSLRIEARTLLKGRLDHDPVHVSFLSFEGISDGFLGELPRVGETFIFFLNRRRVTDAGGRPGTALVLYRPQTFALVTLNAENERKVRDAAGRQ